MATPMSETITTITTAQVKRKNISGTAHDQGTPYDATIEHREESRKMAVPLRCSIYRIARGLSASRTLLASVGNLRIVPIVRLSGLESRDLFS